MTTTADVLFEVHAERMRQETKWGEQNHPWCHPARLSHYWACRLTADHARDRVDFYAKKGELDYAGILTEEYLEALEAETVELVRAELIQVAAVAVAAIESIDRNGQ